MKQLGFFVVGDSDAKFGEYQLGLHHVTDIDGKYKYWENRGYTLVPCFVSDEDFEEWEYLYDKS